MHHTKRKDGVFNLHSATRGQRMGETMQREGAAHQMFLTLIMAYVAGFCLPLSAAAETGAAFPVQRASLENPAADAARWKTVHQLEIHAGPMYPISADSGISADQGTMFGGAYLAQLSRHFAIGVELDSLDFDFKNASFGAGKYHFQALSYLLIGELGSSFVEERFGYGVRFGLGGNHTTIKGRGSVDFREAGEYPMAMIGAGLWYSPVKPLRCDVRYGARLFELEPRAQSRLGVANELVFALSARFGGK